jgi:hypothetical protein
MLAKAIAPQLVYYSGSCDAAQLYERAVDGGRDMRPP